MIDSYAKLPLGLYLDIRALQEDDAMDLVDLRVAIVAALTGKTDREVLDAPIAESSEWFAAAAFLEHDCDIPKRIADSYSLAGWELIPTTDLRKITTAQYIDFQTYAPGGEKNLPGLLSVFLVPKGRAYNDGYDTAAVQQAIRDQLPISDVLALSAFFLTRYAALIRTSRSFLGRILKQERDPRKQARIRTRLQTLEKVVETLRTVGAGSPASTA